MFEKNKNRHFSSFQIISLSFLAVIFAGSLLLMLPVSTVSEEGASFLDALFTATSAVCVTGLVTHDTATWWSGFGQAVILLLIQVGGMGVVTLAVFITRVSGRKIGLMQRSTMQEAIAAPKVGGIVKLTVFILRVTFVIEIAGALLLAPAFCADLGLGKGLWYALFHSISAFCNAGFDLMGIRKEYSSLTFYAGSPVVNVVVMLLIIIGGIGFLTWEDVKTNRHHLKKYRMQSKIILSLTGLLILIPAVYFFFGEFSDPKWAGVSVGGKVWRSLFTAVTPRTAGFNTVDLSLLSEAGQTIMVILMLIGGAPGSTAGGMKITTAAVLFLSAIAVFRREEETTCFGRRIVGETVRQAAAILLLYLGLLVIGGISISILEDLPVLACFFEAASAIATVGLSLGLTPTLGAVSKAILILLMFFGRVGGMTLIFAAWAHVRQSRAKLPQEKITVG